MRSGRPRRRNGLKKLFCPAPGSEIAAEFSAISSITGIIAPLSVALSDRVGAIRAIEGFPGATLEIFAVPDAADAIYSQKPHE